MENIKRWHDHDDKLNILITHIKRSPEEKQEFIAKTMIKLLRDENIYVNKVSLYVRKLRRRWYDYNDIICLAMEHLKMAPAELQVKIAVKLLFNMKKIDNFIEKIYFDESQE